MSEVRLYLGKRGSGKSTRMMRDLLECPRVLLYDTLWERTYDRFQRVRDFPELCEKLIDNPPFFRIAYRGVEPTQRLSQDFERFCEAALACRMVTVAVEEVELYCSPHQLPVPLEHIISVGRHRELSFYGASRRSPAVHPLIRSQCNEIVSFRQTEPRDIQWCREVMGEEADRLAQLGEHDYIRWNDSTLSSPSF